MAPLAQDRADRGAHLAGMKQANRRSQPLHLAP